MYKNIKLLVFCTKTLYNETKGKSNMCKNRDVLLVAGRGQFANLEKICCDQSLSVNFACNFCEMVERLTAHKFGIIFLDQQTFLKNEKAVNTLKQSGCSTSYLIVLCNEPQDFDDETIFFVKANNDKQVGDIIHFCKENNKRRGLPSCNNSLENQIQTSLEKYGLSTKYKGYAYFASIIRHILTHEDGISSFSSSIFPFIASLYDVSVASVERDVRNLIKTAINSDNNHALLKILNADKPSCKNVILAIASDVRKSLAS